MENSPENSNSATEKKYAIAQHRTPTSPKHETRRTHVTTVKLTAIKCLQASFSLFLRFVTMNTFITKEREQKQSSTTQKQGTSVSTSKTRNEVEEKDGTASSHHRHFIVSALVTHCPYITPHCHTYLKQVFLDPPKFDAILQ